MTKFANSEFANKTGLFRKSIQDNKNNKKIKGSLQNLQQPLYCYSLSLCIIFTIEIIAIIAHATCLEN